MDGTYQVNQDWRKLASRIVKPQQIVLVTGTTDVGKSTFCRFLADSALAKGFKVACVDTDIGQSQIGPPTTIGIKSFAPDANLQPSANASTRFRQRTKPDRDPLSYSTAPPTEFYFVGDVSPQGHLLGLLAGTRLMVDSAREADADFVVIDTTGYIHDPPAVILKQHKIELIRPNHLVCIGRSTELEQITACYSQQQWLNIHYLLPHRSVRTKSGKARSRYRKDQFDTYFSDSNVQQVPFEQIRGGRTPFFIGRVANEKELEILSRLSETQVYHAEWGSRTLCFIVPKPLSKATITHIKNYLSLTRVTAEVRTYFERRLVGLIGSTGNTYAIGIIERCEFPKARTQYPLPFFKRRRCCETGMRHSIR